MSTVRIIIESPLSNIEIVERGQSDLGQIVDFNRKAQTVEELVKRATERALGAYGIGGAK